MNICHCQVLKGKEEEDKREKSSQMHFRKDFKLKFLLMTLINNFKKILLISIKLRQTLLVYVLYKIEKTKVLIKTEKYKKDQSKRLEIKIYTIETQIKVK